MAGATLTEVKNKKVKHTNEKCPACEAPAFIAFVINSENDLHYTVKVV